MAMLVYLVAANRFLSFSYFFSAHNLFSLAVAEARAQLPPRAMAHAIPCEVDLR